MAAKKFTQSKLIAAIRAGLLDEVIAAIVAGADIEEADIHGYVGLPLRTACFEGNADIVLELLNRGADINAIASDGPGAPLRLAQRCQHQSIITLLLAHGATAPVVEIAKPPPSFEQLFPTAATNTPPPVDVEQEAEPEPELPPALPDNMIEYVPVLPESDIEEIELNSSYGVDTNLLTFDLMRMQDEQDEADRKAQPASDKQKTKSNFWNSQSDK